jgi:predicted XRE-type DNA-binding protein
MGLLERIAEDDHRNVKSKPPEKFTGPPPPCPKCESRSTRRSRLIERKRAPVAQLFSCSDCGARFLDPAAKRQKERRQNAGPELAERIRWLRRHRAFGYERISEMLKVSKTSVFRICNGNSDTASEKATNGRIEIQIRRPLLQSLHEMFQTSNGLDAERGDLAQFVAEIVETAVAAYRASRHLAITPLVSPKPDETEMSLKRFKYQRILSPRDIEQIHNLFRSGLRQSAIASRFGVGQSTVSRHLDGTAHGHLNGNH